MESFIAILVQGTLAAVAVQQATVNLLPSVHRLRHPELVLDVWLPVALILPLMVFALGVDGSVRGIGWFPIASPIMIALAAFACAMLFGKRGDAAPGAAAVSLLPSRLMLAAVLAGLVLLLLGAAHVLTVWIGQCAFALGAVLLWLNTPQDDAASREQIPTRIQLRAGWSMLLVLLCAIGQAIAALFIATEMLFISGAIMLTTAFGIILAATRAAEGESAMRIGLWAGSLGIFFGLGALSLAQLVPRSLRALVGELPPGGDAVAFGFGAYAFEATLLMALTGLAWLTPSARPTVQRLAGGIALIILVGFVGMRFAAVI